MKIFSRLRMLSANFRNGLSQKAEIRQWDENTNIFAKFQLFSSIQSRAPIKRFNYFVFFYYFQSKVLKLASPKSYQLFLLEIQTLYLISEQTFYDIFFLFLFLVIMAILIQTNRKIMVENNFSIYLPINRLHPQHLKTTPEICVETSRILMRFSHLKYSFYKVLD